MNVLGNGVVIDLESLCGEIETLQKAGVSVTPENFKISERATIVFPYHRALDGLEEARLKDKKYGSTLRGIAPVYSDKYQKKTIMMGELLYPKYLEKRLASILEWKNLTIQNVYGAEAYKLEDMLAWCQAHIVEGATFKSFDTICRQVANRMPNIAIFASRHDVVLFVSGRKSSNGKVLFKECKSVNDNSYQIESADEIDMAWFQGVNTVGICGATSTPKWLMEECKEKIINEFKG